MKCPLLWKTTIDPVSLHLIPSISAQLWLFILGFILLALIIGLILWLFSVRFPSRSERGPFRIYRWWTDHAANSIWTAGVRDDKEGQGDGLGFFTRLDKKNLIASLGRSSNDFLGEGFWRSLFLLRRTRSISWPSHGCIMPAHGMFACSKINWTMQVSFTRKAETKEGQFRKLEDQEMEIGRYRFGCPPSQ